MPYNSLKIIIAKTEFDRRIKLNTEGREAVKLLYDAGHSQRSIARMIGVSRRLVSFILFPEKLEESLKRRAEHGGSKTYYDKEKHTKQVREHRRYKHKLKLEGKI